LLSKPGRRREGRFDFTAQAFDPKSAGWMSLPGGTPPSACLAERQSRRPQPNNRVAVAESCQPHHRRRPGARDRFAISPLPGEGTPVSQPGFHVARDAAAVIQQWWLRPGEGVYWIRTGERPVFEVPGRSGRGRVLKQAGWRTAGRRALAAAEGAAKVLDYLSTDPSTSDDPPGVRVFGTRIDCQAAVFAEAAQWESSWVLTDQRFALLRVTA